MADRGGKGGKAAARPTGAVPKNVVLAKPAPLILPDSPTKAPVVRVAPITAKLAPPGIAAPGSVPVAVISKDKLAYFKDNVADSAEDFDPTDYYYHRDRELMAAGGAPAGAPPSVVPGMPQLGTAPAPGQKQILTHSGGLLAAQPVSGTSGSAILGSAPYVPSQYPSASTATAYGTVMQNGRMAQPQILAGPPRVMSSSTPTPSAPTGHAALRSSGTDPRLMSTQPSRAAAGAPSPAVAVRGAQPTPTATPIPSSAVPPGANTTAQAAGGQRLLLRERSYSGNGTTAGIAQRSQSSSALPASTLPSPRGQQQSALAGGVMRPGGSAAPQAGASTVYSMGQKGGAAATLNYQMNDNVVNRPLSELKSHEDSPAFDASDFPALTRGASSSSSVGGGEFSIQNEDFPALPGSTPPAYGKQLSELDKEEASLGAGSLMGLSQQFPSGPASLQQSLALSSMNHAYSQPPRTASTSTPAAPSSADRFGLLGLLSVIRMTDPDLNVLALGTDLTTLGLNLNSPEALYPSFASPWTDGTSMMRRYEPEYYLPLCYYMQAPMQPPQLKLPLFSDDTLFYIFYSMPKDMLQLAAAFELYNRDWRYHKELQRWFTRVQGTEPTLKTPTYERGSYIYYEFTTGDKMRKDNFTLVYDMLEERPQIAH